MNAQGPGPGTRGPAAIRGRGRGGAGRIPDKQTPEVTADHWMSPPM